MEQLADPGSILVTPETLALAEGFVHVGALGPMAVRGIPAPVEVFEVTGVVAVRSRLHATAARGLTRFVGRDAEMEQLRRVLEQARQGRGQVVAFVGEPGVGKSRLVWEVTHSHRVEGWLVLEAGSVSYGQATSYLPVIDLLKGYFRIGARDLYRDIREKVTGKLLTLDRALEPILPALLALLDVPVDDPQWQALDPRERRQRTLDAVKRLLLREAQGQPLLVIFEDLHWIDSETQVVLDTLVGSLPTVCVLLLVSYRPEYSHPWGSKTYYTQLRLDPLPPESARTLLQAVLGDDPALEALTRRLIDQTEGNPFFLEESVRALVETGVLVGDRRAYRLARPVEAAPVPATVHAVLAARMDRLPAEEKRLLQTASVISKDVPFPLLHAISEFGEGPLRQALAHLQAAEFLYEASLLPELEYTFKHALTHEVAYGSLLQGRRRALHARIVEGIEALYPDRLAEHVERLAHHALRGEVWDKAVAYLRTAGAKAAARSAYREAAAFFEQALAPLARLPDSQSSRELAIDLRLDLYGCLVPLDELRPLLAYLREAETLAEALDDQERLGWARLHICHLLVLIDDARASVQLAHEVVSIAEREGSRPIEARAYQWLSCGYYALGQHRRAVDLLRKCVAVQGTGPGSDDVFRPGYLAMFLAELGEFSEAEVAAEMTLRSPQTAPERPWDFATAYWQIAWFWCLKGDLGRAASMAERAVAVAEEWGLRRTVGTARSLLGHVLAIAGRITEAVDLLERGVRDHEAFGTTWLRCPRLWHLGEAYLAAGRVDAATDTADRTLTLARARGERGFEAWTLRLQAEIVTVTTPVDGELAERRYREAMAIATELEMRPLVAHCHRGLVTLSRRIGDRAKGDEHLTTATTMYREMGMGFWLEKAEAELGLPHRNSS
jgi:tetratricopeptide (TPR) repeat protein